MLIRLHGCAGWSAPLLFAYGKNRFSHDVAQMTNWTASSEFGTYSLCEQRTFRRACASAQSRQNLRCSLIQAASQKEPSDRKPDPWPVWMAGHAQLKFVMTECSKTQIRLTGLNWLIQFVRVEKFCGECNGSVGLITYVSLSECWNLRFFSPAHSRSFRSSS